MRCGLVVPGAVMRNDRYGYRYGTVQVRRAIAYWYRSDVVCRLQGGMAHLACYAGGDKLMMASVGNRRLHARSGCACV